MPTPTLVTKSPDVVGADVAIVPDVLPTSTVGLHRRHHVLLLFLELQL